MHNNKIKSIAFSFNLSYLFKSIVSQCFTKNTFSIVICLILFSNCITPVLAIDATPVKTAPVNQRDKFDTDLYTGSATYSYPITVPKGTDDLTPDVMLAYNSGGVRDYNLQAGTGWQLNQDYIERDVNYTPTSTSDDKYKLHFQGRLYDLVYISSENAYHTKIESYLKIQKLTGSSQNDQSDYWQVTTPNGTQYRFGYKSNSELLCSGQNYVTHWNLDQVQDTHNNHIYYSYTENNGTAYPSEITYNNDNQRSIKFTYAGNITPFVRKLYIQGCQVTDSLNLQTIKTYLSTQLVHEYDLTYTNADSGQPLLTNITEKGTDGSPLPPTTFDYNPITKTFSSQAENWNPDSAVNADFRDKNTFLMDVNADTLPDLVKVSYDGGYDTYTVFKNTGTRWGPYGEVWLNHVNIDNRPDQAWCRVIDVNGDGLPDLVKSSYNGSNATWWVWKNMGDRWNPTAETWVNNAPTDAYFKQTDNEVELSDVNGDGLPDIVKTHPVSGPYTSIYVWKNTGASWSTTPEIWVNNTEMDVRFYENNVRLTDVNGDGLPDFIKVANYGGPNNDWQVFYNTGSSWLTTKETWAYPIEANVWDQNVGVVDVTGDSLPEIVRVTTPTGGNTIDYWNAYMNKGSNWNQSETWLPGVNAGMVAGDTRMGDANGDGLIDIIKGEGTPWQVWKNNGYAPELLSTIHTSQGGTIHFDYQKTQLYRFQHAYLTFPLWIVSKMTVTNGMTNAQGTNDITTYSYKSGFYNWQDKEFRGFGEVDEVKPNGSKKQTYFEQDPALQGKMYKTLITDSSGNPYSEIGNAWTFSSANGIYTDTLNAEKSYTYDGSATNPKVRETDYQYDQYGNVTKQSDLGDKNATGDERYIYNEYTYNTTDWLVNLVKHTYINDSNDTTKVSENWNYYDGNTGLNDTPSKGDKTKEIKWLNGGINPVTTYAYDSYGNVISETDPNSHTTQYTYDASKTFVTATKNAKNQTSTATYDLGTGNLLTKTDPNNNTTTYTYDTFGRLLKEIEPYDSSTYPTVSYTYSFDGIAPENTLVSKRKESGNATTYDAYTFIDGLGRTIQTKSNAEDSTKQIVTDSYYGLSGKVEKQSVPYLAALSSSYSTPNAAIKYTETTYDPLERITIVKNTKGDNKTFAFDHWKVTTIDENGHINRKYSDAYSNIVKVDEVLNNITTATNYTYNILGKLTGITNATGNNNTFVYDTLGRKISETDPDLGTWINTYDGVGNLLTQTDSRNITNTRTYDELNRPTKIDYPTLTDTTYAYDMGKIGTLSIATDSAGTVSYSYNNRLKKTQEQRSINGTTKTTKFSYDASNQVVTQTNPDNEVITYTYNPQGAVNAASGSANLINNLDYNALGNVIKKDYGNGLTTNYSYNTDDFRLNAIQTGALQNASYTYDNVGNILSIADAVANKTQSFSYDDLDRLKTASESANGFNYAYTYNSIGNVTSFSKNGNLINYTYGQNAGVHALTSSTENLSSITPTPTQNQTPTPTPSQNTFYTIYDEGLENSWEDWSWSSTNNPTDTSYPNTGSKNFSWTVGSGYAGLYFHKTGGTDTTGYTTITFALRSSQSGQPVQVQLYDANDTAIGSPVQLTSYGGDPISSGYKTYTIPLADLGGSNKIIKGFVIQDISGTAQPAMYVDTVKLAGLSVTPTPTLAATATPTPTTASVSPINVYDDALGSGWEDWSWSSTNNFSATTSPQLGTKHISWTATSGYAGFYLHKTGGVNTTNYTALTFALRATQPSNSVQVLLYDNTDTAIGNPVQLTAYGGDPTTTGYKIYTIPLSELGGSNRQINGIVIQDITGAASPALYADSIAFVSTASQNQSGRAFTYDTNGNMTADNINCYEYNDANQLAKVKKCSNNQVVAEYIYDFNGNRMVKKNYASGSLTNNVISWTDSYETKYIVGGATENTSYYFVNKELVAKKNSDNSMYYMLTDHLGSTRVVTNASGSLVEKTQYDPWGEILEGGTKSKFLYTGQEKDSETDLAYYNARYYDPHIGRFAQPDDILQDVYAPQTLNRYSYVQNNPLKYTDPTGHINEILNYNKALNQYYAKPSVQTYNSYISATKSIQNQAKVSSQPSQNASSSKSSNNSNTNAISGSQAGFFRADANSAIKDIRTVLNPRASLIDRGISGIGLATLVVPEAKPLKLVKGARKLMGGEATTDAILNSAEKWLGPGYKEIDKDVFRSLDNSRQFRMEDGSLMNTRQGPHVSFESVADDSRSILENTHVKINDY